MKTYVSFHPTHPETYVFREAPILFFLAVSVLLTACKSSRKSMEVQAELQQQEYEQRLSKGQAIFALFDSLKASHVLMADSLELEVFEVGNASIVVDSLAATRPPLSQAQGRLAARLKIKGIRSNTEMSHIQTENKVSTKMDTTSISRFQHEHTTAQYSEERKFKPPDTFCHLTSLISFIAILLGVILLIVDKNKE